MDVVRSGTDDRFLASVAWACGPAEFHEKVGEPCARGAGLRPATPASQPAPLLDPVRPAFFIQPKPPANSTLLSQLLPVDEPYKIRRGGAIAKPRMSLLD